MHAPAVHKVSRVSPNIPSMPDITAHHFELSGWSEVKIDAVFSALALVLGIAVVLLSKIMFR